MQYIKINGVLDGLTATTASGWVNVTGDIGKTDSLPFITISVGDDILAEGFATTHRPDIGKLGELSVGFVLDIRDKIKDLKQFSQLQIIAEYQGYKKNLTIYSPIELYLKFNLLNNHQRKYFLDKFLPPISSEILQYTNPFDLIKKLDSSMLFNFSKKNFFFQNLQLSNDRFIFDVEHCIVTPKKPATNHIFNAETKMFSNLEKSSDVTLFPTGCAFFTNVVIVGYRTVVFNEKFTTDLIFPNQTSEQSYLKNIGNISSLLHNEDTLLEMQNQGEFYFNEKSINRNTINMEGTIAFIGSHEPSNWGSFIFRVIPKLLTLKKLGISYDKIMTYVGHKNQRLMLNFLGIPDDQIIAHNPRMAYKVENLIYPSQRSANGFFDNETVDFFRGISDSVSNMKKTWRKIYISRLSQHERGVRKMENEIALIDALKKIEFEIIDPSELTPEQQIKIFSEANFVLLPSGAALFNVVFCKKGTTVVDMESEKHWISCHTNIFASMELNYHIFEGSVESECPKAVHKNWKADIPRLISYVSSI